jgi:hypothetical protein
VTDRGAVFYKVLIEVRNELDPATKRWRLTPGLTATVDVLRRRHERAWKVPSMALNFQPDDALLTAEGRAKLHKGPPAKDREHWKTVWVVGAGNHPWPVFVRTGGPGPGGETGIRDLSFTEVLEWDADLSPRPEPVREATYPEVIIAAPPGKQGLFSAPNIKF